MRILELFLLALNVPFILSLLANRRDKRSSYRFPILFILSVAAAFAGLAHLWIEGSRWQMVPAYGLTIVNLAFSLWDLRPWDAREADQTWGLPRWARRAIGLLSLVILALSASLAALFPVPKLPALTGPFQVGTTVLHYVDTSRTEYYSPDPGGPRELMVQIWYPAEPPPDSLPGPWMAEAAIAGPAIASRLDLPAFLFSHLSLARTHAVAEAPVAARETPYPVLLFSHGWGGLRTQNISQVEELASQGYIVAALDHTFGAVVTVFPDGRTAVWNTSILPFGAPQAEFDQAANQLMDVWATDLSFILDQLALLQYGDDPGLFRERLDLDRVGVFSHSTGGGAMVVFCTRDPRCKAGLAMDAWLEPVPTSIIAAGLDQPFLFMRSEAWEQPSRNPQNDQLQAEVLANLREAGYRIAIEGTAHFDFSSLPLFSPLTPTLGLKGPINGLRVNDIINAYTLAFFDQYLKNIANPLLDGPAAAYPEVTFRQ